MGSGGVSRPSPSGCSSGWGPARPARRGWGGGGGGGAAEVALVHGVFRMDENTVIILPPPRPVPAAAGAPTAIQLLLFRGRALFQVLKERLQGSFDVITPSVIVGVKGTTFGVEQRTVIGVVVFDGSVEARPAGRPAAT